MNGLELARYFYTHWGREALEQNVPELISRMAVGLVGEGSECFGFDDALSQDHDWGPAFCIWLNRDDYQKFGVKVQEIYHELRGKVKGFPIRKDSAYSAGRVGCLCSPLWYTHYIGLPRAPQTIQEWRRIPEAFLATATNGEVFDDPSGEFSTVRKQLLQFYPEDVRIKKIVARAAIMAQAGQYNYPRCVQRGDWVAARLACAEFMRAAMSMGYLLNRKYAPFYKWMRRGLDGLPKLARLGEKLDILSQEDGEQAKESIEGICLLTIAELRRQGLTNRTESFLQAHCEEMMEQIQDPDLRRAHIMEE